MTHFNPDDLALIALAELEPTPMEREHLAVCTECANDLLVLQHTVAVGRSAPGARLITPDAGAWSRIHSELGLSAAMASLPTLTNSSDAVPTTAVPTTAVPTTAVVTGVSPAPAPASTRPSARQPAPVVAISRARRRWIPLAAATVIGLVAGYGASSWWPDFGGGPSVVARAKLEPLPGWSATGQASVEETSSGQRDVLVTLNPSVAPSVDAPLREVWLLSTDATRLVSLGFLTGTTGRFVIPAEIDLAEYPLVDVSAEPNDGMPAHSADSVVRGELHST
ncbi:hypothetical protein RCH23_000912 [Cryobacterium sp. CAN_C3]|uniref:anti-sigma factor n=1 Tax=unclassified Cryobacterium TaxID=2649013 RepID=UPI0018C9DCA7|nr:anti-sigma factor [Cryobacterium sp. CAN_C3]MEC5153546.1 hypothetical protein [Cryobacterium sp. CAN_C3]